MRYTRAFLEELDLDRLHAVLEAAPGSLYRGDGKTMGYIARMVGEALCGDGFRYMYVGETSPFTKEVMMSVVEILRHEQLPVVPFVNRNYFILEEYHRDRRFDFVSIRNYTYHTLDGMSLDDLWVDLTPDTMYCPRHREFLALAHAHLRMESR